MSRLDEIRQRVDEVGLPEAIDRQALRQTLKDAGYTGTACDLLEHAPADLAYLLERLDAAERALNDVAAIEGRDGVKFCSECGAMAGIPCDDDCAVGAYYLAHGQHSGE